MNSKYKELSGNVFLFAVAAFVPKLISFFLVRLYTGCLSTSDYGIADLITTTVTFIIPIFTFCISEAVLRYALDKKYDVSDVFTAGLDHIFKASLIAGLIGLVLCFIPGFPIKAEYIFFIFINFVINSTYGMFGIMCKGIDKVRSITWAAIVNSVVTISANLIFLLVLKWGLRGFLIANILGHIIAGIVLVCTSGLFNYIKRYNKQMKPLKRELQKYGLPLIFSSIAWWINNASDRYMVSAIVGTSANGIYAVGYKLPNIFESIQNVFMQAWAISAIKHFNPDDSDRFIGKNYTFLSGIAMLSCSALMIADIFVAKLLFAKEFFEAWHYVPLLITGAVIHSLGTFLGHLLVAVKDMKALTLTVVAGAVVNISLNALLIPFMGAMGAAVATLCGYAVIFVVRYFYLKKYIRIRHDKLRDFSALAVVGVQMVFALLGKSFIIWQVPFFIVLVLLYRQTILLLIKKLIDRLPFRKKQSEE